MIKILTKGICLILIFFSSAHTHLIAPSLSDRVFDEYGNICWEDEMARLDNFAITLQNDPDLIGNIIVYDGNPSCREEAIARAVRARKYVIEYRGVEWNRVMWKYGGHRDYLTTMLIPMPRGATEFTPFPYPNEVKVKNCRAKMYRRRRCSR